MDTTCVAGEGDDEGGGGGGDIVSVSEMIEDGCESQVNLLEYYESLTLTASLNESEWVFHDQSFHTSR